MGPTETGHVDELRFTGRLRTLVYVIVTVSVPVFVDRYTGQPSSDVQVRCGNRICCSISVYLPFLFTGTRDTAAPFNYGYATLVTCTAHAPRTSLKITLKN